MPLLPDASVVVRFGASWDIEVMLEYFQGMADDGEDPKMSVFAGLAAEGATMDEVVESVCRASGGPWGTIRVSTAGTLEAAGFELLDERDPLEAACHYHVKFPDNVTESVCAAFIECFSEARANPVPKSARGQPHGGRA